MLSLFTKTEMFVNGRLFLQPACLWWHSRPAGGRDEDQNEPDALGAMTKSMSAPPAATDATAASSPPEGADGFLSFPR
jgi:hypothetical protein